MDGTTSMQKSSLTPWRVKPAFRFAQAAIAIRRIEEKGAAGESDTDAIVAALADDGAAKALAMALAHIVAHEPVLVRALRDDILPVAHRRPIGDLLRG